MRQPIAVSQPKLPEQQKTPNQPQKLKTKIRSSMLPRILLTWKSAVLMNSLQHPNNKRSNTNTICLVVEQDSLLYRHPAQKSKSTADGVGVDFKPVGINFKH